MGTGFPRHLDIGDANVFNTARRGFLRLPGDGQAITI